MTAGTIVGAPNLLFLGAGASRPYGKLLMGEFVRSFRKKHEHASAGPAPVISNPLLDAICEEKKEDLEALIEELEALSSRGYVGKQTFNSSRPGEPPREQERWPGILQLSIEASGLLLI